MPHVTHLLAQYHDGELGAKRRQRVERHLVGCASCRQELGDLDRLSGILAVYEMPEPVTRPAVFRSRVLLRLPRRAPRKARPFSLGWLSVPVSLVLMLVLVQGLWFAVDSIGIVALVAEWIGVDLGSVAALVPSSILGSTEALAAAARWSLFDLMRIGGYVSLYLLMLLVFAFYAGWVGVLVRSMQRAGAPEGDQDGSL